MRLFWLYTYYCNIKYVRRSRLKAFSLHTVHDDVLLRAYVGHVRMTHKRIMYSAPSQSLRFGENTIILNRLHVCNCVRIIEVSDNRGTDNRVGLYVFFYSRGVCVCVCVCFASGHAKLKFTKVARNHNITATCTYSSNTMTVYVVDGRWHRFSCPCTARPRSNYPL